MHPKYYEIVLNRAECKHMNWNINGMQNTKQTPKRHTKKTQKTKITKTISFN